MPFTLAHPAAAAPLRRVLGRYGVLSALVIGSMAPDAVYFLPLRVSQPASHSVAGVFWFCLPIGLVAFAIFHLLVKVPATALLPVALQHRLPPVRHAFPAVPAFGVILSLVAGAMTHVAWDAFTHAETLPVTFVPWLRTHLFRVSDFDVAVWKLLQHVSTVVGLALLGWWTWAALRDRPPIVQPTVPVLAPATKAAIVTLLALAVGTAAVAGVLHAPPSEWTLGAWRLPVRRAVVAAMQAFGAATLAIAVCWRALSVPVTTRR
ncbi:MAG TPA: DUF4184 family protein [Candidatus Binatia bacterium]|jgi:hypothetical protein|nr:DUF4184 family protein [Candidatus Binatia bacterium]